MALWRVSLILSRVMQEQACDAKNSSKGAGLRKANPPSLCRRAGALRRKLVQAATGKAWDCVLYPGERGSRAGVGEPAGAIKTMDAAEKLMLDLMEKHPGASESSLLALFQNVARERPEVFRAIVGHFIKHS
jgi:hypothetical protein